MESYDCLLMEPFVTQVMRVKLLTYQEGLTLKVRSKLGKGNPAMTARLKLQQGRH